MTFAENINRICKEKGTNLTTIIKELKGSSSYTSAINKKGSIPNQTELMALAEMLECSVIDFFADEEDLISSPSKPQDEDEEDILRVYRALSRRNKHEFMAMVYEFEARKELEGDNCNSAAV